MAAFKLGQRFGVLIKGHNDVGFYGYNGQNMVYVDGNGFDSEPEVGKKYEVEVICPSPIVCGSIIREI